MASVVAFGETMLDIHPYRSDSEQSIYLAGACGNLVSNVALLGGESALISKFVDDSIGRWMLKSLKKYGVNTSGILLSKNGQNVINFVLPSHEAGMCEFVTYTKEAISIQEKEIPYHILDRYDVFHFGSYSVCSCTRRAVDACITYMKGSGKKVSYDVNWRPGFWESEVQARKDIQGYVDLADYIKMNLWEAQLFLGHSGTAETCAEDMRRLNLSKMIFLTDAGNGSYLVHKDWTAYVPGVERNAIDTLGAGDAYYSVILRHINTRSFSKGEAVAIMKEANCIAAKSTLYYGTIAAFKKAIAAHSFMKPAPKL